MAGDDIRFSSFTDVTRILVDRHQAEVDTFVDPNRHGIDLPTKIFIWAFAIEVPLAHRTPVGGINADFRIRHHARAADLEITGHTIGQGTASGAKVGTREQTIRLGDRIPNDLVMAIGCPEGNRFAIVQRLPVNAVARTGDSSSHGRSVIPTDVTKLRWCVVPIQLDCQIEVAHEIDA